MNVITLDEARSFATSATPAEGPGRFRVRIISAGVGSSGVYPTEAIKLAAEENVFKAGTHMYLDHPTESETWERPERSVRDLAARLVTDAVFVDEDGGALDADIEVFTPWRAIVAELLETIGVSIRARAEVKESDAQGRPIIARIVEADSVDFVTRAGRGGKILQLIESARATGRAVERGVAEATANDRREQLSGLVKDTYGGDHWVWVRDFDDSTVWFEDDDSGLFQQAYTTTDDVADALTGDRTEVRVQTTYMPVGESAPAQTFEAALARMLAAVPLSTDTEDGQAIAAWLNEAAPKAGIALTTPVDESVAATEADNPAPTNVPGHPAGQTTQESEEDTMPQIEEARLRQLEEDAGRVHALESERDTAVKEAEAANKARLQAEAGTYARDFARNLVTKGNGELAEASVARIVRDVIGGELPLTEAGRLDTDAFTPLVEKARAEEETYLGQVAEASGIGTVRGVGSTAGGTSVTESDANAAIGGLFGRDTKEA